MKTIKDILKHPITKQPISAQFINTKKVDPIKNFLIKPVKLVNEFDEKGKLQIESWLNMAVAGTKILDTATKALTRMEVIPSAHAIHDMINAFGQLKSYFNGKDYYEQKQIEIDDFMYLFLNADEEHQKRVMRFQESLFNKKR